MSAIAAFFRRLFASPAPKPIPPDLRQFEEARADLTESCRALVHKVDTFGDMVTGMSRPVRSPPAKAAKVAPRVATKKSSRSSKRARA